MASDYYPIYASLWNDEKLDGAPFEEHGFFAYLCSNTRGRPSGIYRVTDGQLAADTLLPAAKVRVYCTDLDRRGLIVRDGAWLFVRAYFKRQPKSENLLKGVASDIATCSSVRVLESFSVRYPLRSQWSTDRLATLDRPINESDLQCSAVQLQSSTEQCRTKPAGQAPAGPALTNGFQIPDSVTRALDRAPRMGKLGRFHRLREDQTWWYAETRAHPALDVAACVLAAEAWLVTNPRKAARKRDAVQFMHNWFRNEEA